MRCEGGVRGGMRRGMDDGHEDHREERRLALVAHHPHRSPLSHCVLIKPSPIPSLQRNHHRFTATAEGDCDKKEAQGEERYFDLSFLFFPLSSSLISVDLNHTTNSPWAKRRTTGDGGNHTRLSRSLPVHRCVEPSARSIRPLSPSPSLTHTLRRRFAGHQSRALSSSLSPSFPTGRFETQKRSKQDPWTDCRANAGRQQDHHHDLWGWRMR